MHGNEPAPVYAVKEFIISLSKKEIKRKNLQLDFIFIVNPFGFEYNQRYNGDNKDINRDMKKFETSKNIPLPERQRHKIFLDIYIYILFVGLFALFFCVCKEKLLKKEMKKVISGSFL